MAVVAIRVHPWLPNLGDKNRVLQILGLDSVERVFEQVIPKELRLEGELGIQPKRPMKPWEIELDFVKRMRKNVVIPLNRVFAGGPVCPHYVHPVVQYIISRGEFLTAYTPYQPEINQGILQALYEYQSLMAELLDVDVVNASMYDGATALAEAILMAIRVKGRKSVILPFSLYESYKRVVRTYLSGIGAEIAYYDLDERGQPDLSSIEVLASRYNPAAIVAENPSGHGVVNERMKEVKEIAESRDALAVALVEPLLMGIAKPPGSYGYEVVVGEGQSLGLPMCGGGCLLGIFGIRSDPTLLRQLPGRLIGATLDADGRKGYMMILQTREQHIRREKATSNITTNSALNAIAAAVNLSLLGEHGLRWLASYILDITQYAVERLSSNGHMPLYKGALYFKNVAYRTKWKVDLAKAVLERGVLPFTPQGDFCLSCFTEVHSKDDVNHMVDSLEVGA